jgi:hypothetical protein
MSTLNNALLLLPVLVHCAAEPTGTLGYPATASFEWSRRHTKALQGTKARIGAADTLLLLRISVLLWLEWLPQCPSSRLLLSFS